MDVAMLSLLVCVLVSALSASAVSGSEMDFLRTWADAAFLGKAPQEAPMPPGIEVRRQDHGEFSLRESVLGTPLQIGSKCYEHGLGTHSVSELAVRLPKPGKTFEADAGIDNNYDTAGRRGSVVFVVEVAGKEAFRSGIRRGGDDPLPVRLDLNGAREFTLRVLDADDGPGWDQSDWADAAVTLEDGELIRLDELPVVTPPASFSTDVPFSFTYGGKPSSELLPSWRRAETRVRSADGIPTRLVTYTDPATGLLVECRLRLFDDFPAAEWVLYLTNTGSSDTPIIESIRPLDLSIATPPKGDVVLHRSHGSTSTETDFLPIDGPVNIDADIKLAPNGGRSSDGVMPFFNLEWSGGGLVGAIGWSGQWEMRVKRDSARTVTLEAGQQTTHLKLHPGESIRTPRILLVRWEGDDRFRGHNLLRRLILAHYTPKRDGQPIIPPVTQNSWFTFNTGNDVTEQNQLETIRPMAGMGVECYWIDAGWFEGGWPAGAGSWIPKAKAFPRGLKPLGDAAHKDGMGFVVWFEPERVNAASRIAREHPEWVLHEGNGDGLFNLGDPEARQWLTDFLSKCITDWGIDIYRNDFNIDPLRFWQAADEPDRQGITEIRYIEGLYAMWDALRKAHPELAIDNCASGGRRIDLELISRSYSLSRSDTACCGHAMPVQDQAQSAGLSLWAPLHGTGNWGLNAYDFRSAATVGTSLWMDTRRPDVPVEQLKRLIAEVKDLRPLYLGDYYPLMDINLDERQWCGWQYDRPEIGRGFAMFFRRSESPYSSVDVGLRGLDPNAEYEVEFVDSKTRRTMSGADLSRLRVEIGDRASSMLVKYGRAE